MEVCILQGKSITPEMPGACSRCGLYLNTCSPIIENGFLVGAELSDGEAVNFFVSLN